MLAIDDSLLKELGLDTLPKEERDRLIQHIYETLELRVGMKLAEKMSEDQLDEFERFADVDEVYSREYLDKIKPGWDKAEVYQQQLQQAQSQGVSESAVISEYAAMIWLEKNFPNYKDVVNSEFLKLKDEIMNDSDKIKNAS